MTYARISAWLERSMDIKQEYLTRRYEMYLKTRVGLLRCLMNTKDKTELMNLWHLLSSDERYKLLFNQQELDYMFRHGDFRWYFHKYRQEYRWYKECLETEFYSTSQKELLYFTLTRVKRPYTRCSYLFNKPLCFFK